MPSKIHAVFILASILAGIAFAAENEGIESGATNDEIMSKERIGPLYYGQPTSDAAKAIPCKPKLGANEFWGADGLYHQMWNFADCGLALNMLADKKNSPQTVGSITLTRPSTLATHKGIRIGSTRKEVMDAYKDVWNREDSSENSFVAGSVYGGVIFHFQKDTVSA